MDFDFYLRLGTQNNKNIKTRKKERKERPKKCVKKKGCASGGWRVGFSKLFLNKRAKSDTFCDLSKLAIKNGFCCKVIK